MAKTRKGSRKPSVKVKDLRSKKNPTGGRKAGKGQQEYMTVKMSDVLVSSYSIDKAGAASTDKSFGYDLAANKKI